MLSNKNPTTRIPTGEYLEEHHSFSSCSWLAFNCLEDQVYKRKVVTMETGYLISNRQFHLKRVITLAFPLIAHFHGFQ